MIKRTDLRHPLQPSPAPFDQGVEVDAQANTKVIYWHRDLPPLDAEYMGEHIIEVASARVPSTVAYRDELWARCYKNLMAQICDRLEQEVLRLGGSYAHVLDESIDSRRDKVTGERWLHGCFTYTLCRSTKSRVKSAALGRPGRVRRANSRIGIWSSCAVRVSVRRKLFDEMQHAHLRFLCPDLRDERS